MRWMAAIVLVAACNSGTPCDSSPGTLGGECHLPAAAGQCVDFANLGTTDLASVQAQCAMLGGTWDQTPCDTANRIGTCLIPTSDPKAEVECSANASIQLRYYGPRYTLVTAMDACDMVSGTTFTPG